MLRSDALAASPPAGFSATAAAVGAVATTFTAVAAASAAAAALAAAAATAAPDAEDSGVVTGDPNPDAEAVGSAVPVRVDEASQLGGGMGVVCAAWGVARGRSAAVAGADEFTAAVAAGAGAEGACSSGSDAGVCRR